MNQTIAHPLAAAALCLLLAACGGGGSSFSAIPQSGGTSSPSSTGTPASTGAPASSVTPPAQPAVPSYAIGGTLAGLPPHGKLVLLDNGGDALTLTANGAFSFATKVGFNTGYAVTVGTQPLWSDCKVLGGSGTATADVGSVSVSCVAAKAKVTTLTGSTTPGSPGRPFNYAFGLAMDAGGNLYVTDVETNKINKVTPDGEVSTLAGSGAQGSDNGPGNVASFYYPYGIAADASGNLYVTDSLNNKIRKITPAGVVSTLAGSGAAGANDGPADVASFDTPYGIALDASGNVYVAEYGGYYWGGGNRIRKITPAGVVSTLAGSGAVGATNATGADASFHGLTGLTVDANGNVYAGDLGNHQIRKITPSGVVTTLAGSPTGLSGTRDGIGADASFNYPQGLAVDVDGNLYVVDSGNQEIRRITPDGVVSTLAGRYSTDTTTALFRVPMGVVVDASGNVYVSDVTKVLKITPIR